MVCELELLLLFAYNNMRSPEKHHPYHGVTFAHNTLFCKLKQTFFQWIESIALKISNIIFTLALFRIDII